MTSPDRRRLGFREAAGVLERSHGRLIYPSLGLGRLILILWYMTVGKRRFVPAGADPKLVGKQKKLDGHNRRRGHRTAR
jgi:hypothetical protein